MGGNVKEEMRVGEDEVGEEVEEDEGEDRVEEEDEERTEGVNRRNIRFLC